MLSLHNWSPCLRRLWGAGNKEAFLIVDFYVWKVFHFNFFNDINSLCRNIFLIIVLKTRFLPGHAERKWTSKREKVVYNPVRHRNALWCLDVSSKNSPNNWLAMLKYVNLAHHRKTETVFFTTIILKLASLYYCRKWAAVGFDTLAYDVQRCICIFLFQRNFNRYEVHSISSHQPTALLSLFFCIFSLPLPFWRNGSISSSNFFPIMLH